MSARRCLKSVKEAAEHGRWLEDESMLHGEISEAWRALSFIKIMRQSSCPWLQNSGTVANISISVMNDFPIQEDRPVEPTANDVSAPSLSEATESEIRFLNISKIARRLKSFRPQWRREFNFCQSTQ